MAARKPAANSPAAFQKVVADIEARFDAALAEIRKELGTLKKAFFGGWDEDLNREIPGFVSAIRDTNTKLDQLSEKIDALVAAKSAASAERSHRVEIPKWAQYVGGGVLLVVLLRSLGVPTEDVWKIIQSAAHASGFPV